MRVQAGRFDGLDFQASAAQVACVVFVGGDGKGHGATKDMHASQHREALGFIEKQRWAVGHFAGALVLGETRAATPGRDPRPENEDARSAAVGQPGEIVEGFE